MITIVRSWRPAIGCAAVGAAAVLGFSGAVATAEPVLPVPPSPGYGPVTVTQTVTVAPHALGAVPAAPGSAAPGLAVPAPAVPAPAVPAPAAVPAPNAGPAPAAAVPAVPVAPSTLVPASSGTLRDYFAAKDVRLEPQQPADFSALNITLPVPPGWTRVPDPNVPDAFAVIADRNSGALYTPNAQVVVYQLIGHFDPKEAITHGFIDSQQLPAWRTTNASLADLGSFPSSVIEGTYRQGDTTVNTSQRNVIATTGTKNYLVSLTVNTDVTNSVGHAPATDAIVNGFRVSLPGAAPAVPSVPATAPAATGPASLPALTAPAQIVPATPRG